MTNSLRHFLLPGAIKCSKKPMEITTLLGSCVAVCLWDESLQQGGINHFMMPYWNGNGLASPKYGNIAIEKLIRDMLGLGSRIENITAKVFGGASVLNGEHCVFNIGERNIQLQQKVLDTFGIKVIASSLGGFQGRKLIFNTFTGVVRMKYVQKTTKP